MRLFTYVRRYWVALLFATMGSMLYSGIDAYFIYALKPLLNEGLVAKNYAFLEWASLFVMIIFIFRGMASFASNYFMASASRYVIMDLRQDLFSHLQKLPARFYDKTTSGQVLSILLFAVDQVANASADVLTSAIQAICLIIGLLCVMFSISWKLTLLYLIITPLVTIVMRITSVRIRRLSLTIQDSVGDLNHCAEENIENYKVVRAFGGEAYEVEKFNRAARVNRQREMKVVVARGLSAAVVQFITAAAVSLTLYIATFDIADSLLTTGGFVSMVGAILLLLKPMKDLAMVQNKLYRGLAGAQNVFELLDEKPEADSGEQKIARAQGRLVFSHVNFGYEGQTEVLKDVSFTIEPGEVVALVGRSGSGKSTLISLLTRFYHHYTGEITLDGASIQSYDLKNLRKQYALVSQQVNLFYDTVSNNIAYGCFNASKEDILAAAHASYSMEFIDKLPQQLETIIGENGILLSGGQRQRIAIARAVLKDAPILILDEATSALDTESERYIQAALDQLMKNRTSLVIAHRLSTVEHADKIIVMEEGRVVEIGNHQTLLALNGAYAKLYALQFNTPSIQNEPPLMEQYAT
jgi:subfamily B ATP-binding cassette protein MsbA